MRVKLTALVAVAILTTAGLAVPAQAADKYKDVFEGEVANTLKIFKAEHPNAGEVEQKAVAMLVCPEIKKIGFGVGLEKGLCALRKDGMSKAYYKVSGASWGLIAGIQSNALIMVFTTEDALETFTKRDREYELGIDGAVSVMSASAGANLDLSVLSDPVVSIVMDQKGLMADLSLEGSRFKEVELGEDMKGEILSVIATADVDDGSGGGETARITLGVDNWIAGANRAKLIAALKDGGHDAAAKVMDELPPVGTIKHVGMGDPVMLKYAHGLRTSDGDFQVILATSDPLGFGNAWRKAVRDQGNISMIVLNVNEHQVGDGVLLIGGELEWDPTMRMADIDDRTAVPINLSSVSAAP
jgi:lipid-binding SYLF domain-containing protein